MANDDFDLPRPTDAVPSATSAVINDDAKVLDYVINSTGTVTTRAGKQIMTIDQAIQGAAPVPLNGGVWASGQTFEFYNQYMYYDGLAYAALPATTLPYTVGSTPDLAFVYQIKLNDHSLLANRNAVGAHDVIYQRKTTVAEIASGVFTVLGSTFIITDRGNAKGTLQAGTPNGYDKLDATNGNIVALVARAITNLEHLGADLSGVADTFGIVTYALSLNKPVYAPTGSYLFSQSLIAKSGDRVFGDRKTKSSKGTVFTCHVGEAIKTDDSVIGFDGLEITDIRIAGGATGKYAISSHLPYTTIERLFIEDGTTVADAYKGNGIRLHNDGGQESMGGWGSRIYDSKIVLTNEDPTNVKTSIELDINGGAVEVVKTDLLLSNIAINVVKGQAITINRVNTNRQRDNETVDDNILSGAIILGTNSPGFDVQNATISECYLEGHSRAVLINNAVNTTVQQTFVNDLGFADPASSLPITADGAIYHSEYASNTKVVDCDIDVRYNWQYPIYDTPPTEGFEGVTIDNCRIHQNRGAATRLGGLRPTFTVKNIASTIRDTLYKATVSSVVTYERFTNDFRKNFRDINPHTTATPVDLFTIKAGETWQVQVGRADNNTIFGSFLAYMPTAGGGAAVLTLGSVGAMTVAATGDIISVSHTVGFSIRTSAYWFKTISA